MSAAGRARLAAVIADRNSPQKHVRRAHVVLLTGDRVGTAEIQPRTGLAKPSPGAAAQRKSSPGTRSAARNSPFAQSPMI